MTSRDEQLPPGGFEGVDHAILEGVESALPGWVRAQVARIADAWGRLPDEERAALDDRADRAAAAATGRVVAELRAFFATDVTVQRTTPLEIVRSAYREPTAALGEAAIPPVERDAFDERAWPDDRYGLVISQLGDLGDPDLGPLHLAWGLAKAKALRQARRET